MRNSSYSAGSRGSREKSPCRQKVDELTEKLQTIGMEDETKSLRDFMVQRARNVYEKLEKTEVNEESKSKINKELLQKVESDISDERNVREAFEEEKTQAINVLEKEFGQLVGTYRNEVVTREQILEGRTEEKFAKVRQDIISEKNKRADAQSELVRNVSDHIAELNGMIAAQRKNRYPVFILEKTLTKCLSSS